MSAQVIVIRTWCRSDLASERVEHWEAGACVGAADPVDVIPDDAIVIDLRCSPDRCGHASDVGVIAEAGFAASSARVAFPVPVHPDARRALPGLDERRVGFHVDMSDSPLPLEPVVLVCGVDTTMHVAAAPDGDVIYDGVITAPFYEAVRGIVGVTDIGRMASSGVGGSMASMSVISLALELNADAWASERWVGPLLDRLEGSGFRHVA